MECKYQSENNNKLITQYQKKLETFEKDFENYESLKRNLDEKKKKINEITAMNKNNLDKKNIEIVR